MLLPSLISLRHPASHELTPEDIFESCLGSVFVDDLQIQHGDDPTSTILYRPSNPLHAPLALHTADVNGEEQRRKFAHYLWNAGILMAELVAGRPGPEHAGAVHCVDQVWGEEARWGEGEWWVDEEEERRWSVRGESVLEVGAGVGIAGIMSARAGAREVVITDYPAPPILATLSKNVEDNLSPDLRAKTSVHGHTWNELSTPFALAHAHRYMRVLAADCLWMQHEHDNLAASMTHFLADSPDARVFVIAGFHTGRAKVAPFFEESVPKAGLEVENIFEMDARGAKRPWATERDGGREDVGGRKKWCVLAQLKRAARRE